MSYLKGCNLEDDHWEYYDQLRQTYCTHTSKRNHAIRAQGAGLSRFLHSKWIQLHWTPINDTLLNLSSSPSTSAKTCSQQNSKEITKIEANSIKMKPHQLSYLLRASDVSKEHYKQALHLLIHVTIHPGRPENITSFLALINLQQYVKGFLMTLN